MALVGFMCTSGRDGELTRRSECALVANVEGLGPACWWLLCTSQSRWLLWSRGQAAYEFYQSGVTLLWDRRGWVHVVDFLACAASLEWYRLASCWCVWDKIQCTLTKALISLHHQMAFVSRTSRSPVTEAVCSEFPKCAKLFPVSLWLYSSWVKCLGISLSAWIGF